MKVTVDHVNIPPMSTIGYGWGTTEVGDRVEFVGDHRPMRNIGEAIRSASAPSELPVVFLEDYLIVNIQHKEVN